MKKLTYYILSAVFAVCNLSSCLDEDPIYSQNSAVMFSSQSNAELALLGCYGYLTNSATYGQMMQEALIISSGFGWGQRNSNDDGRMLSLETPTSASPVKTVWNGLYKVVTEANAFLGSLEKSGLSESAKVQMGGEAKFLRGLAYYNLVMLFGDVPLKVIASSSDGIAASRAPKEEVFAQIIQDMKDASLIAAKSTDGRANSWAAKAFLGKVYYKMACLDIDAQANWQRAKEMFDDVYENGPYALEPKFGDLFGDFVMGSKEAIFQLNFSITSTVCFNHASNRFAPSQSAAGAEWGKYRATKAAYDLHEGTYPGDPRIELTFMKSWKTRGGNNQKDPKPMIGDVPTPNDSTYVYPYGTYFLADKDNNPLEPIMKNGEPVLDKGKKIGLLHVVKLPYADFPDPKNPSLEIIRNYVKTHGNSGPNATIVKMAKWYSTDGGSNKWPHFAKMYDQNQVGTASHKNLMVYRYAEMLLLMADVYNELGNTAKAVELANKVLGRARTSGLTPATQPADWSASLDQETVRTKLFFERIIELAGEPGTYEMPRIRGTKYFKMALELNNKHEFTIASNAQYFESGNIVWHDRVFNVTKEGGEGLSDNFVKKNMLMPIPDSEISANAGITNDDNNFGY